MKLKYLIILVFFGCQKQIVIKDYIELNKEKYLVVFKEKAIFSSSNYKVTIVSFMNTQTFYRSFDQHNTYFELKKYDQITVKNDSVIFITQEKPQFKIKDDRVNDFYFKKHSN